MLCYVFIYYALVKLSSVAWGKRQSSGPTTSHAQFQPNACNTIRLTMICLPCCVRTSPLPVVVGEANVLQSFLVTDGKQKVPVAGCRCVKGMLQKKLCFKLLRDGESILDGRCKYKYVLLYVYIYIIYIYICPYACMYICM